jgi:hypothetical protein
MYALHYLKSSLKVQKVIPAHQILAFFVQIAYLAQNKHLHLAPTGYPTVNLPQKPEQTADQRK